MKNKKCVLIFVGLKGSRRGKRRQKAANSEMSSERYNIASGFVEYTHDISSEIKKIRSFYEICANIASFERVLLWREILYSENAIRDGSTCQFNFFQRDFEKNSKLDNT
jgi:hypothetical protein